MSKCRRPRLLDLYCGAGGAGMGYYKAGFEVVGVDLVSQPHYPFTFIRDDALNYAAERGASFDAIHASPPCQAHTPLRYLHDKHYPDLIPATRSLLKGINLPWVIENVPFAPLHSPIMLCGVMFGLTLYRHRLFETSFPLCPPAHPEHVVIIGSHRGGYNGNGDWVTVAGHNCRVEKARRAMGIDWMTGREIVQAIPPAYSEFVGTQLRKVLER